MTFSLAENLPFLALPLGLIVAKVCCPHHLHMSLFSVHFPFGLVSANQCKTCLSTQDLTH